MEIRNATIADLDVILAMIDGARAFMISHGNPDQWTDGYPQKELIEQDITLGEGYVCAEGNRLYAYFMLRGGDEADYEIIDGEWLNQRPYMTLHRVLSSGEKRGMVDLIVRWSLERCQNLRGDTHLDNLPMRRAFERNGFTPCGTIWIFGDKDMPRIAYHHPAALA